MRAVRAFVRGSAFRAFAVMTAGAMLLVTSCSSLLGLTDPTLDADEEGEGGVSLPQPPKPTDDSGVDAQPVARCDSGCPGRAGPCGVKAGPLCVDSTEVTIGDYRAFLEATVGTTLDAAPPCEPWPVTLRALPPEDALPVTHVTFCEARAFCAWADKELCGSVTGGALEREEPLAGSAWAYACTGGTTDPIRLLSDGGCHVDAAGPRPASGECEGGFRGLFDMSGNVAEWVNQPYARDGGAVSTIVGGSFFTKEKVDCETQIPGYIASRLRDVGFRCCAR
jgi:formylglycine-generating enzyme